MIWMFMNVEEPQTKRLDKNEMEGQLLGYERYVGANWEILSDTLTLKKHPFNKKHLSFLIFSFLTRKVEDHKLISRKHSYTKLTKWVVLSTTNVEGANTFPLYNQLPNPIWLRRLFLFVFHWFHRYFIFPLRE